MSSSARYNIISHAEELLLDKINSALIENITAKLVAEFKEKAEQEVKKEVEKLTIEGIESIRNLAKMHEEVTVYCKWNEGLKSP